MAARLDGIYSMLAASAFGCSSAICSVENGELEGNCSDGCRLSGTVRDDGDEIDFDLTMESLPGHTGLRAGALAGMDHTHRMYERISLATWQAGSPIFLKQSGSWVVFRRLSDDLAPYARFGGMAAMGRALIEAHRLWQMRMAPARL